MNETRALFQSYVASLAFRTEKALGGAPPWFAGFRAAPTARSPHEIVCHMTGLIGFVRAAFHGESRQPECLVDFDAEVERFRAILADLARDLDGDLEPRGITFQQMLQGPLADAMTHAGQLALLRRLGGTPIHPAEFPLAGLR